MSGMSGVPYNIKVVGSVITNPGMTLSGNVSLKEPITVGGKIQSGSITRTSDYEKLDNKPSIESVTLIGNKTFEELGMESISNAELNSLLR